MKNGCMLNDLSASSSGCQSGECELSVATTMLYKYIAGTKKIGKISVT
jgi:hypothetical protein